MFDLSKIFDLCRVHFIFRFSFFVILTKNEKISCTVFAWKWQLTLVTSSPKLTKSEKWKMKWTRHMGRIAKGSNDIKVLKFSLDIRLFIRGAKIYAHLHIDLFAYLALCLDSKEGSKNPHCLIMFLSLTFIE